MVRWAAQWYSKNRLDGVTRFFCCESYSYKLFRTRRECRKWIMEHYGFIKTRPDLRAEPHGWRVPRAVRVAVTLTIKEASCDNS